MNVITHLHTNAHSYTSLKGVRVGENRVKERKGVVCLPDVKLHWTLTVAETSRALLPQQQDQMRCLLRY